MKLPLELITEIFLYLDKDNIMKYKNIISSLQDDYIWLQLLKRDYYNLMHHKQLKDIHLFDKYQILYNSIPVIFIRDSMNYYNTEVLSTDNDDIRDDLLKVFLDIIKHDFDTSAIFENFIDNEHTKIIDICLNYNSSKTIEHIFDEEGNIISGRYIISVILELK